MANNIDRIRKNKHTFKHVILLTTYEYREMFKYVFSIMFFACQLTHATFLLSEKNELIPLSTNYLSHPDFDKAHLLTITELENGLWKDLNKQNIIATYIPQTCWDLFALLTYYNEEFNINGDKEKFSSYWVNINNSMINFIRSQPDALDHYKNKQFDELSRIFSRSIQAHLKKYHTEVERICGMAGDKIGRGSSTSTQMWLFSDSHFPEIEQILVQATRIEQECFEKDEIPFWRHSRTKITVPFNQKDLSIIDMPLFKTLKQKHGANKVFNWGRGVESDEEDCSLALGTLSYGFSLLANMKNDGSMGGLCDYGIFSACTFSYFLQDLRDNVYAKGTLPFYQPGELSITSEEVAQNLRQDSTLQVIRFPKALFSMHHKDQRGRQYTSQSCAWYIPLKSAMSWIELRGERSHPRHRGTFLKHHESDLHSILTLPIEQDGDASIIRHARLLIEQTNTMQILAIGTRIINDPQDVECQQLLAARATFANEILEAADAQNTLQQILKTTRNGNSFF